MGKKDSFSPSNRSFAGQTNCFTSVNSTWALPAGRPPAGVSSAARPLSLFERAARFTGLTFLAMAGLFCAWLVTAWLLHGLVHSFDPVPLSGVFAADQSRPLVAAAIPLMAVKAEASRPDSRLLRAVRADLDDSWRQSAYEKVVLPELGNQGACVVWHQEIGQLGMIMRVASPADQHGIPLDSRDLLGDLRGQMD